MKKNKLTCPFYCPSLNSLTEVKVTPVGRQKTRKGGKIEHKYNIKISIGSEIRCAFFGLKLPMTTLIQFLKNHLRIALFFIIRANIIIEQ